MTDKQTIIDGKECRYWFTPNPDDYRKCSLRGKNDNCDEIKDCFVKELLGKLILKEQECEGLEGRLKYILDENRVLKDCATNEHIDTLALKNYISTLEFSNDQLKDVIKKYEECNKFLVEENGKTYTRLEYKLLRILAEIKEIAEGMHDLWINKTPYTDMDNLVKHLLECELNRIRYKLDEISECEVENDR